MGRTWRRRKEYKNIRGTTPWFSNTGRRGQEIGRELESGFCGLLEGMQQRDQIDSFEYHAPHSAQDLAGFDFTVVKEGTSKSFGVTRSHRRWKAMYAAHPENPPLYMPYSMTEEEIIEKVLSLFE